MHRDVDFNVQRQRPANAEDLIQDLELATLFEAMSRGDRFLHGVVSQAILCGESDLDTVRYRQDVLRDCLRNPDVIRELYQIPVESAVNKQKHWLGVFSRQPSSVLSGSVDMMLMFVDLLKRLRGIADAQQSHFESEGFSSFFAMIRRELDDDYFAIVDDHLQELELRNGVLISAVPGMGNEGTDYVLHRPRAQERSWLRRTFSGREPVYSFTISDRDDSGARALGELRDRGITLIANALAEAADHIDSFFRAMRIELGYYVGCLNLQDTLADLGCPVCLPSPTPTHDRTLSCRGLYDVCLALTMQRRIVGNDVAADGKPLVVVTGANQGGKSTFLRSVGLSQMMMQCGMFVAAEAYSANLCSGVFTHYRRKEDATMTSGKLDEELARMSAIADAVRADSLVLFNESFAATNGREGSEIAWQVTCALIDEGVKVLFVTHQYEFARRLYRDRLQDALFLRADRQDIPATRFRLTEGEPLRTSFGEDVYRRAVEAAGMRSE